MNKINQVLLDRVNEVKVHIKKELDYVEKYLNKNYEDFSPEVQEDYNFAQSIMVFILFKDTFSRLTDYLEKELERYTELEKIEKLK